MVNSDRGGVEYGGHIAMIAKRIDSVIDGTVQQKNAEQVVSAGLRTMLVLVEAFPQESSSSFTKAQVRNWAGKFMPWLESRKRSLPAKFRDDLLSETSHCLVRLEQLASL